MAAFEYWTHGVATLVEETSTWTPSVLRQGFGSRISSVSGASGWLHLAIPTPHPPDSAGWGLRCTHLHLQARSPAGLRIERIHLRQGEVLTFSDDAVAWTVPAAVGKKTLHPDVAVSGPLVLCLFARWSASADLWIVGAGLRFEEVSL